MSKKTDEKEIDLLEIIKGLWARKSFVFKSVGIGIIVGLVVAFSIPREYTTPTKLVPEVSGSSMSSLSSLSGLAAMAGINAPSLGSSGEDAIRATLYPDVVHSLPFMVEMLKLEVNSGNGEIQTTLYDYLDTYQKKPWWSHIFGAPFKLIGFVFELISPKEEGVEAPIDPAALTRRQELIVRSLRERVGVTVDVKSYVITVSVTMQDAKISADLAQVVLTMIQEYIVDYRTQKVKKDLAYAQDIYNDAKEQYYQSQHEFAVFEDRNQNISSSRYRTELDRLRNEMDLDFSLYTSLASNLEQAKIKVQEETPVYAVIEPASRPSDDSAPNKPLILIAFCFLAGLFSCAYLIIKHKMIEF